MMGAVESTRVFRRVTGRIALITVIVAGALLLSLDGRSSAAAAQPATVIAISGFQFFPGELTVPPGTEIRWHNEDAPEHLLRSGGPNEPDRGGQFGSETLRTGDSFALVLSEPGAYPYFCELHSRMQGRITITPNAAADSAAPVDEAAVSVPDEDRGAGPPTVTIKDFLYQPETMQVTAGTVLTWVNRDLDPHVLASGMPRSRDAGRDFESPLLARGDSFVVRFARPGIYWYFCRAHPWMTGAVVVSETPPPASGE